MRTGQAIILLATLAACGPAPQRAPVSRAIGVPGGALHTAQQQLRGAVHPQQQRQLVDRLKIRPDLAPLILTALQDPAGAGFEPAADLAAAIQLDAAFEPLLAAVAPGSGPHRAAALRAANSLRPRPTAELVDWLDDDDADLQLQALLALTGRDDVPSAPLLPLLECSSHVLARAAARALPNEPTVEQDRALAALDFRSETAAAAVIEELGKRQLSDSVMAMWLQRLRQQLPGVQCAILAVLRSRPEALAARELLIDLVTRDGDPLVRFEALHCLITVRAAEPEWLLARSRDLPRQHQLLCALGLLARQRDEGARLLYDLAFGNAEPQPAAIAGDATPEIDPVTSTARLLLSQAAGLPLHQGQQAFATWSEHPKVARPECLTFTGSAAPWFAVPAKPADVPPELAAPPR